MPNNQGFQAYRIISGSPKEVERILNEIGADYAVQAWNFATCDERVIVTAICISASLLRQAAIASQALPRIDGRPV